MGMGGRGEDGRGVEREKGEECGCVCVGRRHEHFEQMKYDPQGLIILIRFGTCMSRNPPMPF